MGGKKIGEGWRKLSVLSEGEKNVGHLGGRIHSKKWVMGGNFLSK